jgi:hypothetical protein
MNRYLLKFREGRDTGGTFTQEIEALNAADAIAQGKLLHERTSPRPTLVKCEPVKPYEITYHIGEIQGEMQIDNLQVSADKQPHCCPVCYGRGFVAQGFYSGTGETFMSAGGVVRGLVLYGIILLLTYPLLCVKYVNNLNPLQNTQESIAFVLHVKI